MKRAQQRWLSALVVATQLWRGALSLTGPRRHLGVARGSTLHAGGEAALTLSRAEGAVAVECPPQYYEGPQAKIFDEESPKLRSDTWLRNFLTIPRSKILRRVNGHLLFTLIWSACVVLLDERFPDVMPTVAPIPVTSLGTAITLLLAFRTGQAYDRYWEGRGIWADVWASCRSSKRVMISSLRDVNNLGALDAVSTARALALLAIFPIALIHHLRGEFDSSDSPEMTAVVEHFKTVTRFLLARAGVAESEQSAAETAAVADEWLRAVALRDNNVPLAVTEAISLLVHDISRQEALGCGRNSEYALSSLEQHLDKLGSAVAAAERLVMTPVPPSYTRHTSRLLTLYTLLLPLCFDGIESPGVVLMTVFVISWSLFALEEIDKVIEEPFGTDADELDVDLPCEKYAALICADVLDTPSAAARDVLAYRQAKRR